MSDSSSNSKRYLVIGGSSGIGYAVAEELIAEGHAVTCASRRGTGPDGAGCIKFNLAYPEGGLDDPEFDLTPYDGIVISGGMGAFYGPHEMLIPTMSLMTQVNLIGPLFVMNEAIVQWRRTKKPGVVVAVTSTAGDSDAHGLGLYAACKKGVEGFITAECNHQAKKGVRLCAASLGWVESPMTDALKPHIREAAERRCPGGKFATAEDAAEFICHLLTTRAPAYGVFRFHAPD